MSLIPDHGNGGIRPSLGPARSTCCQELRNRGGDQPGTFRCWSITDGEMGAYHLSDEPYLLYLPHCARPLYEALFTANFSPQLAGPSARVVLGNDLSEYIGFVRDPTRKEEFSKPKKKRKGKEQEGKVKDGVLERLGECKVGRI
jgi:hypothetical protein